MFGVQCGHPSAGECAHGDVTTKTVESSFAIRKEGLYGTFYHVSEKHLQRYATEFDFEPPSVVGMH